MIPKEMFFTRGVGIGKNKLSSFEAALRDAGIEKQNLVYVSSILPPKCKIISRKEGIKKLSPGEITYCVMARNESNEPNRLLASSVGVAIPKDRSNYGYISEHHSYGESYTKIKDYAEDLAATMLASTLGIPFDIDKDWDERKEQYKIGKKILKSYSTTQSANADKQGKWTTVIATAVFINNGER